MSDYEDANMNGSDGEVNSRSPSPRRNRSTKGRGHRRGSNERAERYRGKAGQFESLQHDSSGGPSKSVEGWIIIVSNIHEEAQDDDIYDRFADYGEIKQLHLNLDRQTGFVKGYALIEYEQFEEAKQAIEQENSKMLLERKIHVDWAFKRPTKSRR